MVTGPSFIQTVGQVIIASHIATQYTGPSRTPIGLPFWEHSVIQYGLTKAAEESS